MEKLPRIIGLIIVLTIAIIIITTIKLKHKEAPEGEFKDMVGASYVGSFECKKCHERRYLEWTTTLHSKMMQDAKANPLVIIGDFDSPSKIRTFNKEDVDYTLGNQWKQQYLKKEGDDYVVLPAQYNIGAHEWEAYYPADKQKRLWFKECGGCHATGVDPGKKTFKEPGIGCEACHGPGSNHVRAIPGFEIATIINPVRLPALAAAQICGSCHTKGKDKSGEYAYPVGYMTTRGVANLYLYFDPVSPKNNPEMFWQSGDSKEYHQQYLDWQKSQHAKAGVTCTKCHTIHTGTTMFQTVMVGDALCKSCHTTTGYRGVHRIHTFGSCIDCHMARTVTSAVTGDLRSHTFKFASPELSIKMGGVEKQPNSCSGCHKHKDTPLTDLVGFIDAAKSADMPKPWSAHRREVSP
ncbi:MAG: cytochrome c3 family protein [Thermodesulfovibrionia bacterium]|nr:cytochrome c3 family protein [Thermodesulfovibrionia bacterium]